MPLIAEKMVSHGHPLGLLAGVGQGGVRMWGGGGGDVGRGEGMVGGRGNSGVCSGGAHGAASLSAASMSEIMLET